MYINLFTCLKYKLVSYSKLVQYFGAVLHLFNKCHQIYTSFRTDAYNFTYCRTSNTAKVGNSPSAPPNVIMTATNAIF